MILVQSVSQFWPSHSDKQINYALTIAMPPQLRSLSDEMSSC